MTDPVELFEFRLAGHLGKSVAWVKTAISESEFAGWVRYSKAEPFGFPREDIRAAQICQAALAASPAKIERKYLELDFWRYLPEKPFDAEVAARHMRESLPKAKRGARRLPTGRG